MRQYNVKLPERQIERLKALSGDADLPASEIVRRMLDYCFRPQALNEMIPVCSGRLLVQEG